MKKKTIILLTGILLLIVCALCTFITISIINSASLNFSNADYYLKVSQGPGLTTGYLSASEDSRRAGIVCVLYTILMIINQLIMLSVSLLLIIPPFREKVLGWLR